MSNVHSLWGQPTGERTPQPELVAALEDALERARSGEIVGAAFATVYCDGLSGWSLAGRVGGNSLIGALEMVKAAAMEVNRNG
jgi:hypothetical protein